jgi:hypothetical protein
VERDSRGDERPRRTLLTARDLKLLDFAAQHRLILAAHAQSLLGVSVGVAQRRMRALVTGGYLVHLRVFAGQPGCYQISREGLAAAGSDLPPPRLDLREYAHDLGLAWLWLAAQRGTFGPVRDVLAERTLRSEDARAAAAARAGAASMEDESSVRGSYGVRLGGVGPQGGERLHYPDLLLITPDGGWIAVELELTRKSQARREGILIGYGSDARVRTVLYLVDRPGVGRAIERSARHLGIESLVHVQPVQQTFTPVAAAADLGRRRSGRRERGRAPETER